MARTDTLSNFLTDIAIAIRKKTNTTATIKAANFDEEIAKIGPMISYYDNINSIQIMGQTINEEKIHIVLPKNISSFSFQSIKGVKELEVESSGFITSLDRGFYNNLNIEKITLIGSLEKCSNLKQAFATCQRLQYILGTPLDCSNVTNFSNTFSNAQSLVEIRFTPNTIKGSLSFSNSPLLSNESINSIINGLDALNTSPTLILHSSIKNSLTNEQLNTISSKGWNIL